MMLEQELCRDMIQIYKQADKECQYRATRFLQMIECKGVVATAKELISKEGGTTGFTRLWECKRLDLSLEALVLSGKYDTIFSQQECEVCKRRLQDYGYLK